MTEQRRTNNAARILDQRHKPTDADVRERSAFHQDFEIAELIRATRDQAGLSQRALAKLVGTSASVICRLEDAEYEGHSLSMLRRIAAAMGKRIEIRFIDDARRESA